MSKNSAKRAYDKQEKKRVKKAKNLVNKKREMAKISQKV